MNPFFKDQNRIFLRTDTELALLDMSEYQM